MFQILACGGLDGFCVCVCAREHQPSRALPHRHHHPEQSVVRLERSLARFRPSRKPWFQSRKSSFTEKVQSLSSDSVDSELINYSIYLSIHLRSPRSLACCGDDRRTTVTGWPIRVRWTEEPLAGLAREKVADRLPSAVGELRETSAIIAQSCESRFSRSTVHRSHCQLCQSDSQSIDRVYLC